MVSGYTAGGAPCLAVEGLAGPLGAGRACLKDPDDEARCLLTFAKSKAGWRLVGMQAMDLTIPLA